MALAVNKLLLVEDDFDLREVLCDMFMSQGYQCDLADNGAHALELMSKNDYVCVVSDIKMPIKTGIDLVQDIEARNIKTPVFFITACNEYTDEYAYEKGASGLIYKPFSMDQIKEITNEFIDLLQD